ncbi:hypothetical protein J6590_028900 [Homalodisca vitripennis]|nr:hypothetical protein J6590_028900 [Homalodisca vitripennis]
MVLRRKEDRHIGLKDFGRSMPALPCFAINTTLDTLQDSGIYLRATEALNSVHSWGRRMSNPPCKQTGLTPSPPGALKEDRHIGLKDFGRSMPALPCFAINTTLDTLQDSGIYLRATEALNSVHSWGRRMSNPPCKQTGLTPSPPGAL